MNIGTIPIQTGPASAYRCFTCGALATGGHFWLPCNSPLDAYAGNIFYLRLPCHCNHRVARLGDAITPLEFVRLSDFWAQIAANTAAIERALAVLCQAVEA